LKAASDRDYSTKVGVRQGSDANTKTPKMGGVEKRSNEQVLINSLTWRPGGVRRNIGQ